MIDAQITFLPVSDLGASSVFYGTGLGLPLVVDQGSCLIYRVTEDAYLGICARDPVQTSDGVIFTFVTDDVDGWCDGIAKRGIEIESGPEHSVTYGIHHAFLRDPDGNRLEIQRFDDPDWSESNP